MNVLITGGTGFIGSRLALKCYERGDQVRVLGQENTDPEKQNSRDLKEIGVEVFQTAMSDVQQISDLVKHIDVVFHLAAAQHEANVPDQIFWDVNVSGHKKYLGCECDCRGQAFRSWEHDWRLWPCRNSG